MKRDMSGGKMKGKIRTGRIDRRGETSRRRTHAQLPRQPVKSDQADKVNHDYLYLQTRQRAEQQQQAEQRIENRDLRMGKQDIAYRRYTGSRREIARTGRSTSRRRHGAW